MFTGEGARAGAGAGSSLKIPGAASKQVGSETLLQRDDIKLHSARDHRNGFFVCVWKFLRKKTCCNCELFGYETLDLIHLN